MHQMIDWLDVVQLGSVLIAVVIVLITIGQTISRADIGLVAVVLAVSGGMILVAAIIAGVSKVVN